MNNNQPMRKNPKDLCSAGNAAIFNEILNDNQHVVRAQEKQGRKKRIKEYSKLLSCRLINIEIQPFEVPPDRALLTIRSTAGYHREDVQIAECFALIDFLRTMVLILFRRAIFDENGINGEMKIVFLHCSFSERKTPKPRIIYILLNFNFFFIFKNCVGREDIGCLRDPLFNAVVSIAAITKWLYSTDH